MIIHKYCRLVLQGKTALTKNDENIAKKDELSCCQNIFFIFIYVQHKEENYIHTSNQTKT